MNRIAHLITEHRAKLVGVELAEVWIGSGKYCDLGILTHDGQGYVHGSFGFKVSMLKRHKKLKGKK